MTEPTGYTALDLIGFTDQGEYDSTTTYVQNDLVHYDDSIWRCLVDDTTGQTPAEGTYWTIFVEATGGSGASSADAVTYDNTTSGLTASNVQDALDEVVTDLSTVTTELDKAYKYDDTTDTSIADDDYIPFYDTSASAMKKILVSNADFGGGGAGSLFVITTDESTLDGMTVSITDGTLVWQGTFSDGSAEIEGVTAIGSLTITSTDGTNTASKTLTISSYSKYTVNLAFYTLYGFRKTKATSDPEDRITYLSDCDNAEFTAAYMDYTNSVFDYGSWEDAWFMPKPCLLAQDGTVYCYLNPDDYTLDTDGNDVSSYLTGSSGTYNAMMQWPKIYVKREDDGTYEDTYICDMQLDSDYHCYSNIDASGNEIDYFYTRIFEGSVVSSTLRSISGKTPMNTIAGTTEITYATANNQNSVVEWYTGVWSDRCLINDLLTLISKSTDHQTAFGNGHYTGGSSASSLLTTGQYNDKGLFYGTNGTGACVKVFGMENWWGNLWERIAGCIQVSGVIYAKMTYGQEDGSTVDGYPTTSSSGMISTGLTCSGTSGGYISATENSELGCVPYTASGSSSTYECDGLWWNTSNVGYALVGGSCDNGLLVGSFALVLSNAVSHSNWNFGASLSCKPLAS